MAKTSVQINFAQGVSTKVDPKQISAGQFLVLQNSVFDEVGALTKRNGFLELTALPNPASYLTTFNGALTAIGATLQSFSPESTPWVTSGSIQPLSLNTLPLVRNSLNQTQCDSAVSPGGLICTVYSESNGSSTAYKYSVADSVTGQSVTQPKAIPVSSGTVTGAPRVFLLGNYFVIVFTNVISAASHLQYISVSIINPSVVTANADIASAYVAKTGLSWDGVVVGQFLYLAYNTTTGGQQIKITSLSANQAAGGSSPAAPVSFASSICTIMSMCADVTILANPVIYASFYDGAGSTGNVVAVDQNLNKLMTATQIIASGTVFNITCTAKNGVCTSYYEVSNNYSYDSAIPSHFIDAVTCTLPATVTTGTAGSAYVVVRSVGLASKAFLIGTTAYFLAEYQSQFQPTYFLINGSTSTAASPIVVAKLAYQNGGVNTSGASQGYLPTGLPSVTVSGSELMVSYLYKDLVAGVSKATTGISSTPQNPIQTANIYSQTGVNLATMTLGTQAIDTAEIGSNLNISGGFLAAYDGYQTTEQNFFLWPDNVEVSTATGSGSLIAQQYFYQFVYSWTDNQGNVQRSAPSIPISITTTTSSSTNTLKGPYLRLTYKASVKIEGYRWSAAQQVYYQFTSITQPTLNSTTSDSWSISDANADSDILGGNILYTTGGTVEDVNAPASDTMTLFDDRLWLIDSEDRNLLWYSKQAIESTPVEMSDQFTFYVAPTTAAQGSTGVMSALSPMDDKLIIFKKDAIYYINGTGPDNTGANNQYSQPIFITSTVGCALQKSIVFTPNGLMFQSDKGIWLLGRDLSVTYIGAPVEAYTKAGTVVSALGIPETNQIRFTMSQGITLLYDYYVNQWGTFVGIPGVSSALYQGLHTFIDQYGRIFQENPGSYLDGGSPVLIAFKTGWLGVAGLRGYERIHEYSFLGDYYSPHKLVVQTAYDYGNPAHQSIYSPPNYQPPYGGAPIYGDGAYGGNDIEQFRVFAKKQKCKAFQISVQEVFDPSFGTIAGEGVSLSGINLVVTPKKGWAPVSARNSVG